MTILENIIYALGLTYTLVIIGVLCRPHGLTVLRQSTEVLMGVILGELEYRKSEDAQEYDEAQSEIDNDDSWNLAQLMRLERGLHLLKLLYSTPPDSDDDDDDDDELKEQ